MEDNLQYYSCCFTGYRPQKFPFPLKRGNKDFDKMENGLTDAVFSLHKDGCNTFYTGMAMGFDLVAAEAVLFLKKARPDSDIKLIAVRPFPQQAQAFTPEWKECFETVLKECDGEVLIERKYCRGCYATRNRYMVDQSDFVVTWFDGQKGGTKNTLDYAKKRNRGIINLNENESKLSAQIAMDFS